MTDIVTKDAGGVESVDAVYAGYKRRIADIRWLMNETKPNESTDYISQLAYGIFVELKDETRLPPEKQKALIRQLRKVAPPIYVRIEDVDTADRGKYGYDDIVTLYVASRMSMRKIADELDINVSTVSRHVRKWAEQNAELRGDLTTAREVELARLDKMLEDLYEPTVRDKMQILDRKYRLMGLYASGPQVVVGIGVQQGQQQASQPRVIEGVARDISDETV